MVYSASQQTIRMTDAGHRQGNDLMVDQAMLDGATEAADFLKALGNENRLLILCHPVSYTHLRAHET